MRLTRLFNDFFNSEKAGGIVLICVTLISLGLANSLLQKEYISFWNFDLGDIASFNGSMTGS